jgi:hypothetical protein
MYESDGAPRSRFRTSGWIQFEGTLYPPDDSYSKRLFSGALTLMATREGQEGMSIHWYHAV